MAEVIFGIVTVILGSFILWEASRLPRGVLTYALDPALFPRIIAVGLIALGILLSLTHLRHKKSETSNSTSVLHMVRLLLLIGSTVGYILFWDRGSFLINTFLYLFVAHLITRYKPLPSALSSIVVTLCTYLLFTQVFRVRLF